MMIATGDPVNENFDMSLSNYAVIDFEIEMANASIKDLSDLDGLQYTTITKPGLQVLNGQQSLGYSRIRKAGDGDYKRAERLINILTQISKKLFT